MTRSRSEGRARRAFLAAAIVAAVAAAALPAHADEGPARIPPSQAASTGGAALERYEEMLARPLFSAARRPKVDDSPAAEVADPDLPRLLGVVIAPGRRLALVEVGTPPKAQRAGEGGRLGTMTVEKIEADRIVLRLATGRTAVVRLRPGRAQEPDGSAAPVALPETNQPSTLGAEDPLPAAAASPVVSRRPRPGSSG